MTDPTEPATAAPDLEFEHASFDAPEHKTRICNVCGTPISDVYYTHGATTICPRCQPTHAQKLGQSSFMLAVAYGVLAAVAGALVYYGIRAVTGYELGIIAIGVGIGVGIAVRKGAGPSTSKIYRLLALALTYFAVVSTYIPMIANDLTQNAADTPVAVAYVFAAGLSLLMPYFLVSGGQAMGLIIIAIGLWEAWRRSAPRVEDHIAGPFQINSAS
jgi:hypothetical protein